MSVARTLAASLTVLAFSMGTSACAQEEAPKETEAPMEAEATTPELTDAEIAHIVVTANAIDIAMGKLALEHTDTESVEEFANTMITDHSAVNEQAAALAAKLGVTPQENAVSQSLQAAADEVMSNLETLNGEAFNHAYMEREVGYHQAVLDAVDNLLIPQTTNEELRALLVQVRPAFVAHLEYAQKVNSELGAM